MKRASLCFSKKRTLVMWHLSSAARRD
jgi:hypothetical protein